MGRKITDLLLLPSEKLTYSFEVTPDILVEDIEKLQLRPSFYSITWHAKLYSLQSVDIAPLRLAKYLRDKEETVLLHLSCDKLKKVYLNLVLGYLKTNDICNLFLILGDGFDRSSSDFKSTSELITYIRQHYGHYFCIGIAGHCDEQSLIAVLKEKVECGADFILSQAFFNVDVFKSFWAKCRSVGIVVPIIPGLFPYETIQEIEKFIQICKINKDESKIENILDKNGLNVVRDLIYQMYTEMDVKHFHIFTLNKILRTSKIINAIHAIRKIHKNTLLFYTYFTH